MADDVRVALVTGAARGIGAATVRRLCRDGYRVVAVDIAGSAAGLPGVNYPLGTNAELDELAAGYPGRVLSVVADVRDPAAMSAAAEKAVSQFGRLDVAVAAAAVIVGGAPLWETPAEHLRTLLDVDVIGVWNTAAAVIPLMLDGPDPSGCRFVAIASAAGSQGLFHLAGYNVAKHAVVGLVRGLAADLVGTGVTAVAISPGSTDTAMLQATADLYGLASANDFAPGSPLRRLLQPHELADTIAFCSSASGAVLNGSVVSATGGWTGA